MKEPVDHLTEKKKKHKWWKWQSEKTLQKVVDVVWHAHNLRAVVLLDVSQLTGIFLCDEVDRDAFSPETTTSTDSWDKNTNTQMNDRGLIRADSMVGCFL